MSDTATQDTSNTDGKETSGDTSTAGDEFKPITSQDDLNEIVGDRVQRERAKYADYKDLKAKAAKLADLESANQTDAEKAQARIAELETEVKTVRMDATRRKIAGDHGITDGDDIELFLTGTDEETLTRQAKRLADREADRKKNGNHVSREGNNTKSAEGDDLKTVRALFGGD